MRGWEVIKAAKSHSRPGRSYLALVLVLVLVSRRAHLRLPKSNSGIGSQGSLLLLPSRPCGAGGLFMETMCSAELSELSGPSYFSAMQGLRRRDPEAVWESVCSMLRVSNVLLFLLSFSEINMTS